MPQSFFSIFSMLGIYLSQSGWLQFCAAFVACLLFLATGGCSKSNPVDPESQNKKSNPVRARAEMPDSHVAMVSRLQDIAADSKKKNPYLGSQRLDTIRRELDFAPRSEPIKRASLLNGLGVENLKLGKNQLALQNFDEALSLTSGVEFRIPVQEMGKFNELQLFLRYHKSLAWLRIAETENCINCTNGQSCIFPVAPGGIHTELRGTTKAIELLQDILNDRPGHLPAKWLVHLLKQLRGDATGIPGKEDPGEGTKIPRSKGLAENNKVQRFKNVAVEKKIASLDLSGGLIVDDFNGDGLLDLVTSTSDTSGSMKFHTNDGDGSFTNKSRESNLSQMLGGLNMVQTDFDNDGDLDIYVMRGAWWGKEGEHPNSLLRNDGHGKFEDVTLAVGLAEKSFPSLTASWADFDNDGDLDLFVGADRGYDSQLFRNDDGVFLDVANSAGISNRGMVRGACWGDFDKDGYPDLYVSNLGDLNRLFRNNRDGSFTDVAAELGVCEPTESFACWFWDYNNDGHLDLFVASYSGDVGAVAAEHFKLPTSCDKPRLYKGSKGEFLDVSKEAGLDRVFLAMGANFGDANGDGFEDFYIGTGDPEFHSIVPNLFFQNVRGQGMVDSTADSGLGHLQKGHGIAFADFDEDGDQDIFIQLGGAFKADHFNNALFENSGPKTNWIKIKLIGEKSNKAAIGTRVKLQLAGNGEPRYIFREINSGGSFGGNPLRSEIGLGNSDRIISLEIFWPASDISQEFKDVQVNRLFVIHELDGMLSNQ